MNAAIPERLERLEHTMLFATSDLHGFPLDKFLKMLEKAGFSSSDHLYVIGDVIDRFGDGGIAMLRWMMRQENVTFIKGNHEDMLLKCDFLFTRDESQAEEESLTPEQERALKHWNRNGSSITIENMMKLKEKDPEELNRLLDYIRSAPIYVETAEPMKRFVLVHGGLKDFAPEKRMDEYDAFELMWTRPVLEDRYWDNKLVIIGHTPTHEYGVGADGQMLVTKTWVDIDTGAADGGSPMLLRLDDMHPFYTEYRNE